MNKKKAKPQAKSQSNLNTKKTLFAPEVSDNVMSGLRENLMLLNMEGLTSPQTAEEKIRNKHMYMVLANTALQQCSVSAATFSSACECKAPDENEKLLKLFSSMSILRQVENVQVSGKDGFAKYEKTLNDVIAMTSTDEQSDFSNMKMNILKNTDPQTDREGFFILSMTMLTAKIRQIYEENLKNGNIVSASQGNNAGIYSFKCNIEALYQMLQDITNGYIVKHPQKTAEPEKAPDTLEVPDTPEVAQAPVLIAAETPSEAPTGTPTAIPQKIAEQISKIQKGCRNYIMTASFTGDNTAENWYLAPFVDSVVEMLKAKNVTFSISGDTGKIFQSDVNDINDRVALAFSSISRIMRQSSQEHGYLKDEKIGEMISAQIGEILNSNSDVIRPENDDIKDKDGALSEGNTTKKIKESLKNITADIDSKIEGYCDTVQTHLPLLELCRANIRSSPELLNIALDKSVNDGDAFYFKAKKLLTQAQTNIGVIISIVNKDKEVAGEVGFIKQLIELAGTKLFISSATAIKKTAIYNLSTLKGKYKKNPKKSGKSGTSQKLVSEKIKEKFGDNKYFSQEMCRRMMRLMPKVISTEEEDKQIDILAVNKKRNEEFLKKMPTDWMPDFTKEDDKPYYQNELIRIAQRYLPLDENEFKTGFNDAIALAKELDIATLRPQVEPVTEAVKKETPEQIKKRKEDEARRDFNQKNKAAILEQAGDYSENLLVGFADTALRLNNDKGEATTERDLRLKNTTKLIDKKIVRQNDGLMGIIEFASQKDICNEQENAIILKYKEYLHEKNLLKIMSEDSAYYYYGNEKYRVQIEQIMGDKFGLTHRKEFEELLLSTSIKIGKEKSKKKPTITSGGVAKDGLARIKASGVATAGVVAGVVAAKNNPIFHVADIVKNHIADISAYDNGKLSLLTPYLANNDEIYQAISGTDAEYDKFYEDKLPIIAKRMNGIYQVFTDSRIYFIAMTLKMKLEEPSKKHMIVADLILDISENDEDKTIKLINYYAQKLSKAEVTNKGIEYGSKNTEKTLEGIFSAKLLAAGSEKATSDSLSYQNMLIRGVLDSVIFSKKSSKVALENHIAHFNQNSKSLSECPSFKKCMAEFDKQRNDPKNKADKKQIESKKYAFENVIMSFFADDMAEKSNNEFIKDLDERVFDVIKEQEKSKAEGIAMQATDAIRREKSRLKREEILAGKAVSEKQKNVATIMHHLSSKQISVSNQMGLATNINENYQTRLNSTTQEKKDGQLSQTEVREQKGERESLMRNSLEEVTKDFLKSHNQTSRQKKIPALKRYISKHDGGADEMVQNVVAELLIEHDVDPESGKKERQFEDIGKSAVDEKLVAELKKGSDDIAARTATMPINGIEEEAEIEKLEVSLAEADKETQELASIEVDKKAEDKAVAKQIKKDEKAETKAQKSVKPKADVINKIIKAVGEIHRLLAVSFEKLDLSQSYVGWALSSIIMRYGDKLTALSGNELVSAVYTLASEFKTKLEAFDGFLQLENLAKEDEETYLEYKDRTQFLSIELSSMRTDDFNKVCEKEIIDFLLYCNSCKISKEQVAIFSKKYAENEIEIDEIQKNKAILSLIFILRGRIASGKISDVTALESAVIAELSDRTTFNLLTQSGYTVEGVNSDDQKTNEHLAYSTTDKLAFENFLYRGGEKPKAFYKSLSQRDRAVFFAILGNSSMWPHISQSNTASTQAISEFVAGGADEMQSARVIQNYANGEEVNYNPKDYTFAIDSLLKSGFFVGEKVNDTVFKSVVKILDGLRAVRRAHRGINSDVLNCSQEHVIKMVHDDAKSKINHADEMKKETEEILNLAKSVSDEKSFLDYIIALRQQTGKQVLRNALLARQNGADVRSITDLQYLLNNKDKNQQLMILIGILQNRSIVDTDKRGDQLFAVLKDTYSKMSTMEKFYADAPGREEFIEQFSLIDNSAISELLEDDDIWKNAALSLISYQVSSYNELEDVESIKKEDIVGAWRFYTLDVGLLDGAFVLLDSVMKKMKENQVLSMASRNVVVKEAKPIFEKYEKEEETVEPSTFEEFIISQSSGKDSKSADTDYRWVVRRYMLLPPQDKELVMAVLEDRTMLDLTKKDIGKERFGWTADARQQISANDRSDLMEEYVKRGRVAISTSTSKKALLSLLTSQINEVKSTVDNIKSSSRSTIVDWKLFNRAIEFLTLCQTAKKNYEGRRALEKALLGGSGSTGYDEDVDLYSSNQRKSGNQLTRIGGSTIKSIGLNFVPDALRTAIGKIGFLLSTDPTAANKFAQSGILPDDAQEQVDAARAEEDKNGTHKNGAEYTEEMLKVNMSKGQMTIFDMAKSSVKSVVSETFKAVTDPSKLGENASNFAGKAAKASGMGKEDAKVLAGRVNDIGDIIGNGIQLKQIKDVTDKADKVANNSKVNENIEKRATAAGADGKLAVEANKDAHRSLKSGMKFAQSAKIQNIVSSAISFLSSFADTGHIIDPSGLLDKLVEGGFMAITALINGIIGYCKNKKNVKDFIRIGDFNEQIEQLAKMKNSGISPEKAKEYTNMQDDDKKLIWMSMHGMDMNDAVNYVGKEVVYALKFSVSKSCKLPYLRAMGVLIFATLGFTVAGGEVFGDNEEIFDKLLGSR